MPSTLTPRGSTRAWRKLREPFAWHLAHIGPLPCARCGHPIRHGDRWDLGHHDARALGGTDSDVWPEHATTADAPPGSGCTGNRNDGARLGNRLRRTKRPARHATPSRHW